MSEGDFSERRKLSVIALQFVKGASEEEIVNLISDLFPRKNLAFDTLIFSSVSWIHGIFLLYRVAWDISQKHY